MKTIDINNKISIEELKEMSKNRFDIDEDFIEFDSMINLRPSWENRSRGVDNEEIQRKIKINVDSLIVV